jgi:hypothetical protein
MRDELRERLANELLEFDMAMSKGHHENVANAIIRQLETFMREHGLKMVARPDVVTEPWPNPAESWWDRAPLTPWEKKDASP